MDPAFRQRLASFRSWPSLNAMSSYHIAEAGFSYSSSDRTVECRLCGLKVTNWNDLRIPMYRHMKKNPHCPYLYGRYDEFGETIRENRMRSFRGLYSQRYVVSPFELGAAGQFLASDKTVQCASCKIMFEGCSVDNPKMTHYKNSPECPFVKKWFQTRSDCLFPKPKTPKMKKEDDRLATFKDAWTLPKPTPVELARCGFYYIGINDRVMCFHCHKAIEFWQEDDDPWILHKLYANDCYFINKTERVEESRRDVDNELSEETSEMLKISSSACADDIPGTMSD